MCDGLGVGCLGGEGAWLRRRAKTGLKHSSEMIESGADISIKSV